MYLYLYRHFTIITVWIVKIYKKKKKLSNDGYHVRLFKTSINVFLNNLFKLNDPPV